ncbi:sigma-70 family RNA polymerase sigma factor [Pseudomonas asplenii]|uniref:sigma-70 family RNA polymerase sigma factor n=1 Tax=Pseudomonas asplenii TaxID=53407 RepID=UPI0037C842D2
MDARNNIITMLFVQNHAWLRWRAGRILNCYDRGEDVAAETFLRILKMPDVSVIREPRAVLSIIAKRVILDSWRREDLERAYLATLAEDLENTLPDPEEHAIMLEMLYRLDSLLGRLSNKAKQAFVYSQFAGLTYQQIAERQGVSVSRVHQYMEQAFFAVFEVTQE